MRRLIRLDLLGLQVDIDKKHVQSFIKQGYPVMSWPVILQSNCSN